MTKTKTDDFIDLCYKFENLTRTIFVLKENDCVYYYISGLDEFRDYRNDINIIRALRNVFQHNKTKIHGKEAFELNSTALDFFEKIIDLIENPLLVKDVYIKDIFFVTMNDLVSNTIHKMKELNITHVPVLDDNPKL